jgi:predicted RNase H-like HicB family nuclease
VAMKFKVEVEREEDGRRIAEVSELPGVLVYGDSVEPALRVLADRLENGEAALFESVSFAAA